MSVSPKTRSPWPGRLVGVLVGAVLVAAVEAALHLVPGFRPPELAVTLATDPDTGVELRQLNPVYPRRFFAGAVGGYDLGGIRLAPHRFVDPPPDSGMRVLVAGASTVQGYPHPARLALPSFLGTLLADAFGRPVQVLNLGITSLASFAVARVVDDALRVLDPDLLVVYTGHNEFYGIYGAASLRQGGSSPWTRRLHYELTQTRLASLVRWLVAPLLRRDGPRDANLLAVMGSAGTVGPTDPARERAAEQLRASLEEIVEACRGQQVEVVLVVPVGNDAGFAPDTTGGRARDHFDRARSLQRRGQTVEAREGYVAARDADPAPWRAPSALQRVVRDVAAAGNIPLADGPARLAAASPDSIVGWELMVDHVHPTARGHALLARAIVEMLAARRGRLQVPPGWSARAPTDAELLAAHGADGVEAYALAYAAAELLARPPLEQHDRSAWNRRQAELGWQQLSPAEQAGFSTWVRLGRRPPLALTVADKLFEARRFADAVRHYSAARLEAPFTPWADLWPALRQGRARMYLQDGTLTAEQHRELQLVRRRAALVAGVPETDPAFMRTFYDYADRLSAAPSAGPDR